MTFRPAHLTSPTNPLVGKVSREGEWATINALGNRRAAFGASELTDKVERLTHEDLRKWAEALDKEMPRGLGERLLCFADAWREQFDCSNTNKS